MSIVDWASAFAAVASAVAAIAALKAARRANTIASESKATADKLAQLERDRWRFEMTPTIEGEIVDRPNGKVLEVKLAGPIALGHLDSVTFEVVDERTISDSDGMVFGPYCFAEGGDRHGRRVGPVAMHVGERHWFAIDLPGREDAARTVFGMMRLGFRARPMRLVATCRRAEFEPWQVPLTVSVHADDDSATGQA